MDEIITVEQREKLYNEIWEEPIAIVSKRYGMCDMTLKKRCNKLNIPLPPSGCDRQFQMERFWQVKRENFFQSQNQGWRSELLILRMGMIASAPAKPLFIRRGTRAYNHTHRGSMSIATA